MRNLTLYTEETILDFGKYKNSRLGGLIVYDSAYLKWCVDNIDWFVVNKELLEAIFLNNKISIRSNRMNRRVKSPLSEQEKILSRHNNSLKYKNYLGNKNNRYSSNMEYGINDWGQDNSRNWLAQAAGTDDPEVMNDVYWNLD